jgi:hypothetical protein
VTFDGVLDRFRAKPHGESFKAHCPAHEDRRESLALNLRDDKILVKCHAGCNLDAVLAAVGLTMKDLFVSSHNGHKAKSQIVATYEYRDHDGVLRYQKVRTEDKKFFFQKPDTNGGWIKSAQQNGGKSVMDGVERLPYRLNELLGHNQVFVVEGEKDADRLWTLGLPATTNDTGASDKTNKPKWTDALTAQLKQAGVTRVICLPDNDDAGRAHMQAVAASCSKAGIEARIVELPGLPAKGDVSNYLDAGYTDLLERCESASPYTKLVEHDPPLGISESQFEAMNAIHAVVRVGADEVVLREEPDQRAVFQGTGDLSLRYRNQLVTVGYKASGEPILKALDKVWLSDPRRRSYERVVFAPTGFDPAVVNYRPGVDYNLWRGLAIKPDDKPHPEQRCPRYLELMQEVVCNGVQGQYDFLLKLLAFKAQFPGRVSEVVVFVLGIQGGGKGTLFRRGYLPIFRHENWEHAQNPNHILGKFNALLAEKVAVFIDEGIDPKDRSHVNAVKTLATEDTITIERKGIDAIKSPNFAQLFVATNSEHAWHTEVDDRRAFILRTSDHRAKDTTFFGAVRQELESGGREALLALLLDTPVTADELRRVPETQVKAEHADHDLEPIMSYYLDALRRGTPLSRSVGGVIDGDTKWDGVVLSTTQWFQDFRESPQGMSPEGRRVTERAFAMRLAVLVPEAWKGNVKTTSNRKANGYFLRDIASAQKHFDELTKRVRSWEGGQLGAL